MAAWVPTTQRLARRVDRRFQRCDNWSVLKERETFSIAWNPEITESLHALLDREGMRSRELNAELSQLATVHGNAVYSELIYLLCRLRFEPGEAHGHWRRILDGQAGMERQLGAPVDPRVALIHYFLEVQPSLESPIVIEMQLFEEARESAYRDDLTGLRNYRFFAENLDHEVRRSDQINRPVSLVMIDIDDFKAYNDHNGHQQGSQALAMIARVLEKTVRVVDGVARYGGEEFTLIMPATSKLGALQVAERARQAIDEKAFEGEAGQPRGKLTASFGVATYPADAASAEELVRNADRALYVAKSKGKNAVEMYRESRRSFKRLATNLQGSFRSLGEEFPLQTVDLSTGGVKFKVDNELPAGALLDVRVRLPETSRDIAMAVRVVGVGQAADGKCDVSARTLEIGRRDLGALVDYLRRLDDETSDVSDG